ncbi:AAA family ATPase [uncultured Jatrophihabitans sp.]|uniref:helix-turn-helix transcriptional regulator n=1 Tax=uncultured Jatrophihabitans sp. TaxID=1610747 RepID=UPI0035CB12D5
MTVISARSSLRGEWPFVGRDIELAHVRDLLNDPDCAGVVIAAPSGVGKTRMAQECLELARIAGHAVARATATSAAAAIPLAALGHLLSDVGNGTRAHDRAELLRRARMSLLARTDGARLALLVDDAHLLDDLTATLLHQLIEAREAFVIMTLREREPAPEALVTAWKDGLIERMELGELGDDAVERLLTAVLGQVDPDAVAVLTAKAQQNVLFLRELVLGALTDSALVLTDGVWRLRRPLTPSARLVELIETTLRGLSDDARSVVEIVAMGEPMNADELSDVVDLALAEALEKQGIVSCRSNGVHIEVQLAHPLYGQTILSRLPVLRMRSIARMLAERIERSTPHSTADLLRIGRLRLLSGDGDPQILLDAAIAARWNYAFSFAELLVQAAAQACAGFDADLLAAELAGLQGRSSEAEEMLLALPHTGTDRELARVAIARMDNFLIAGRAEEHLQAAMEAGAAIADPFWRSQMQARSSPALVMSRGPRATWQAVRELVDQRPGPALVWTALTGAHALCRMGQVNAAMQLTERGLAAQLELDEPIQWYPWFHLFNRCEILVVAGRLKESEQLAREQHEIAVDEHSAEAQASFASQLAAVLTLRGRVEAAARYARESFVVFEDLGRPMFMRQSLHRLAAALAFGGHVGHAREALANIAHISEPAPMYDAVELAHTQAWVLGSDGHIRAARERLVEVVQLAEDIGDVVGAATALHSVARLGGAAQALDQLCELATAIEGAFNVARLQHVRGLVGGDPVLLGEAAAAFAAIGADLLAVEAYTDAAVRWDDMGEQRHAAAAGQHARRLLALCEGARTPRLRSMESRLRLTAAEFEAAELAARGHSNKAIADELVLSVRSVENRLQRAYEKLGITSREHLANALEF